MSDAKDFRDQILKGFWHDLKDHLERDAIIVVNAELDLADVARNVTQDNVAVVQGWISKGHLAKPTGQQIATWNLVPTKEFSFVIAQPYVLIQDVGH